MADRLVLLSRTDCFFFRTSEYFFFLKVRFFNFKVRHSLIVYTLQIFDNEARALPRIAPKLKILTRFLA